jgi:pimeloyl-ACP methyl ester carboxylesterase
VRHLRFGDLDVRAHIWTTPRHPGGASAAPIVIVHGLGTSHRYSDRLQRALQGSRDTYSLDLPGFGGTRKPSRRLSVDDYAGVIARAADVLGIRSACVIGHSMGAQFAAALACQRPDLVSHLVLAGPVVDPARRSARLQMLDLARDILGEPLGLNAVVFSDYLRCGPRWFLRELEAMLRYRLEEAARQVRCPVLVVRGVNDPIARAAWCAQLAAAAPEGRLLELADSRHVVQHTAPSALADAVLSFAGERAQDAAS